MTDTRFPLRNDENKDFLDLRAGDESHRHGDYIPRDVDEDSEDDLEIGDLVALNADGEVIPYDDSDSQTLAGILYSHGYEAPRAHSPSDPADADMSDGVTVKVQGTGIARGDELIDGGGEDLGVGDRSADGALLLDVDDDDEFVHILLP